MFGPVINHSPVEYYMMNETTCDPETNHKYQEILHENTYERGGHTVNTVTFKIPVTRFGVRNWNGRKYSEEIMMKAWDTNPLIQDSLHAGPNGSSLLCGEAGHPNINGSDPTSLARQCTIDPKTASHRIHRYWKENGILFNEWETLVGGEGSILYDRMLSGFPAMASTRSIGGVDKDGNVLLNVITVDSVIRPSERTAIADPSSYKFNSFGGGSATGGNVMSESAIRIDYSDAGLKDFLLTESVSRDKICRVCDALNLNYDSMYLSENALYIERIDENVHTTVVMPLNKLVGTAMHNLF